MKVILWIATGVAVVFATDGCATAARLAVERVEGLREARFAYAAGEGLVTFDTTMTSVPEIVAQLERMTDFSATERPGGGGSPVGQAMEDNPIKTTRIELVYFEGCPNAAQARDNLRLAIEATGQDLTWSEWDLMSDSTPSDLRRYGSPTVLVDGEDVTGGGAETMAMACRADGAPSVELIAARLS